MVEESEAALESASNLRISALPASPFCQRRNPRQIIGCTKPFQQKIAKRRSRFTNRHARMLALLEQDDRKAELVSDHRHQASAKAGADDRQINVAVNLHRRTDRTESYPARFAADSSAAGGRRVARGSARMTRAGPKGPQRLCPPRDASRTPLRIPACAMRGGAN